MIAFLVFVLVSLVTAFVIGLIMPGLPIAMADDDPAHLVIGGVALAVLWAGAMVVGALINLLVIGWQFALGLPAEPLFYYPGL